MMTLEELREFFKEEERKLEESHKRTMEGHKEFMVLLNQIRQKEECKESDKVY